MRVGISRSILFANIKGVDRILVRNFVFVGEMRGDVLVLISRQCRKAKTIS